MAPVWLNPLVSWAVDVQAQFQNPGADFAAKGTRAFLCISPPLRHWLYHWRDPEPYGFHHGRDVASERTAASCRWALGIPHGLSEAQRHLQRHCLWEFVEVCCYRHVPPLPFWCTGPLDSEPGRLLSAARLTVLCLHRSPEFIAVGRKCLGLLGLQGGSFVKRSFMNAPLQRAAGPFPQDRGIVPEEAVNYWGTVQRAWCLTGSGRRAASASSAVGALTMGVRLSAIGIASRPPCRLRLGTRLNPQGQSPVAAPAANRPCLPACVAAACLARRSACWRQSARFDGFWAAKGAPPRSKRSAAGGARSAP